jgi:hypothetical protein
MDVRLALFFGASRNCSADVRFTIIDVEAMHAGSNALLVRPLTDVETVVAAALPNSGATAENYGLGDVARNCLMEFERRHCTGFVHRFAKNLAVAT